MPLPYAWRALNHAKIPAQVYYIRPAYVYTYTVLQEYCTSAFENWFKEKNERTPRQVRSTRLHKSALDHGILKRAETGAQITHRPLMATLKLFWGANVNGKNEKEKLIVHIFGTRIIVRFVRAWPLWSVPTWMFRVDYLFSYLCAIYYLCVCVCVRRLSLLWATSIVNNSGRWDVILLASGSGWLIKVHVSSERILLFICLLLVSVLY